MNQTIQWKNIAHWNHRHGRKEKICEENGNVYIN